MKFALLVLMFAGCIEHRELRMQQCAHRCIERRGWRPPTGAYGSIAHGDRCDCTSWNGGRVHEGKLTSDRWPE